MGTALGRAARGRPRDGAALPRAGGGEVGGRAGRVRRLRGGEQQGERKSEDVRRRDGTGQQPQRPRRGRMEPNPEGPGKQRRLQEIVRARERDDGSGRHRLGTAEIQPALELLQGLRDPVAQRVGLHTPARRPRLPLGQLRHRDRQRQQQQPAAWPPEFARPPNRRRQPGPCTRVPRQRTAGRSRVAISTHGYASSFLVKRLFLAILFSATRRPHWKQPEATGNCSWNFVSLVVLSSPTRFELRNWSAKPLAST